MFSATDTDWLKQIRLAETERNKYLQQVRKMIREYAGKSYKQGWTDAQSLENHAAEMIALMVPQLASGLPFIKIKPRVLGDAEATAKGFQAAINKWCALTDLRELQEQMVVDYCFCWHIWFVAMEKRHTSDADTEDPALWPTAMRLPYENVIIDPCATSFGAARYVGHCTILDRDQLIDEAKAHPDEGWDIEAIEELTARAELDKHRVGRNPDTDRDEVSYWQIWVPELENDEKHPPEKGYHGQILTVGIGLNGLNEEAALMIRDPYPFFGPRWGPYGIGGAYIVPDEVYPLSMLISDESASQDLNAISGAISEAASRYRRFVAVNKTKPDIAEMLESIDHDAIAMMTTEDIGKNIINQEIGGSTRYMHDYEQVARERLDRKSGIFEAMRGNVSGEGTATENTLAAQAATTRFGQHLTKFKGSMIRMLRTVAWYMNAESGYEEQLGPSVLGAMTDPFTKGPVQRRHVEAIKFKGRNGGAKDWTDNFDDYEFDIDIGSMGLTAEEKAQKHLMVMQGAVMLYSQLLMLPGVDGSKILAEYADINNMPELVQWFNFEAGQKIAAMQQMALQGQPQGMDGSQPGTSGQSQPQGQGMFPTAGTLPLHKLNPNAKIVQHSGAGGGRGRSNGKALASGSDGE